jgi:hypothetical protein
MTLILALSRSAWIAIGVVWIETIVIVSHATRAIASRSARTRLADGREVPWVLIASRDAAAAII